MLNQCKNCGRKPWIESEHFFTEIGWFIQCSCGIRTISIVSYDISKGQAIKEAKRIWNGTGDKKLSKKKRIKKIKISDFFTNENIKTFQGNL